MTNTNTNTLLILVILLSAFLRFYALDRMALWGDEACMVYLCNESPEEIVGALAADDRPDVDVAPPLYFLTLHLWMSLLGSSVIAFRAFSVMFGILTVWSIYRLAKTLFNSRIALIAAILAAINPFQIWYSQEGRMYSMAGFLATCAMAFLALSLKKPTRIAGWVGLALSGTALIYTQYYGALLIGALVLHAIFHIRTRIENRRQASFYLGGVVLFWTASFAPWLPVLLRDYLHAGSPGGFPLMFHWLLTPAFLFIKSTLFGVETFVRDNLWLYPVPVAIAAAVVLTALRQWRHSGVRLLSLAMLLPFFIVYFLSLLGMRVYKSHPFIIFQPALIVLMAYGWSQWKPRVRIPAAIIYVSASIWVLFTLVLGGNYVKPRVHHTADWIISQSGPGTTVAVIPAFMPNPMPIVGDLLAFRYHSGEELNTQYLAGDTAADLTASILAHGRNSSPVYVVFQDNMHVKPFVDETLQSLSRHWIYQGRTDFPSRSRGFSMAVIRYENRTLQDHQ